MKISLIHPSRGRPTKALSTFKHWIGQASGKIELEHILSIDLDDETKGAYLVQFHSSKILINDNDCVVKATNHAAKISTGDVLIYLSDDFMAPKDWDLEIFSRKLHESKEPVLLKVHDNLQPFNKDVLTIPIMNRVLYERLGYFWHPEYLSMFVDQDLYHVCKNNNWLQYAPLLIFPHEHYSIGKATRDATYVRSDKNWIQGEILYRQRQSEGFKI